MQIAFLLQFAFRKDVLYMTAYDRHIALEQFAQLCLRQPHGFVFKTNVQPNGLVRLIDNNLVPGGLHLDLRVDSAERLFFVHVSFLSYLS